MRWTQDEARWRSLRVKENDIPYIIMKGSTCYMFTFSVNKYTNCQSELVLQNTFPVI